VPTASPRPGRTSKVGRFAPAYNPTTGLFLARAAADVAVVPSLLVRCLSRVFRPQTAPVAPSASCEGPIRKTGQRGAAASKSLALASGARPNRRAMNDRPAGT
jgi:hypothetical protein